MAELKTGTMLDLHKLRIFIQVAQAGSFTAAAKTLLMTQSGVSQHIQELEHMVGSRLFDRKARGVSLTPSGSTLLSYAEQILSLVNEAENAVADLANLPDGSVKLGATPGVGMYVLPAWIADFRAKYPPVVLELSTRTTPEILVQLRSGQLDLGVIEGELDDEHTGFGARPLQEVEQRVVVGPQHGWSKRTSVHISELNGETLITRQRGSHSRLWLDDLLKTHNVHTRIAAEFDNVESIKRAVGGSTAVTVLPHYTVEQEEHLGLLKVLRVEGATMQRTIRAVWNASTALPPAVNTFLSHIAQAFNRASL